MSELSEIKGVGPETEKKLEESGLGTLMSIATSSPTEIANVAGMSEAVARKIIRNARESLKLGFEKAKDFAKAKEDIKRITTGCKSFDDMLGGGFESGALNEVYGEWGTGKTQLCHLLAVRSLMNDKTSKAIFIDTENTVRKDRLLDFAKANGLDPDDVLDRIYISRAYNSDHQMLLIDEVERMLQKDNSYRILIVDSLTSHFRAEFIGRGTLANRQQKLNKHLHQLLKIADIYNLVVVISNQVQSDPGQMFGNPIKPIGGNIVGHASTIRIYLRRGKAGSIHADLVDSPNMPRNECSFILAKNGFDEVK